MKKFILLCAVFQSLGVQAQKVDEIIQESNKGKFFVFWGWNRSSFSTSDIHFKGSDYDFTLSNVKASDKPKPFGIYYLKPTELTIPQTNFRIGYFFKENYTFSLGVDHMKYVMRNNQTVPINGNIQLGGNYDGTYNDSEILITEDFLLFEHTDGLNYVNAELARFDNINKWFGISSTDFSINLTEGLGIGFLYPKTNTTLLAKERYDDFNVSGFGISAHAGLNLTFFKHFFFQSNLKIGYIDMNDIRTTKSKTDKASQSFTFVESMYVFGARFRLSKK